MKKIILFLVYLTVNSFSFDTSCSCNGTWKLNYEREVNWQGNRDLGSNPNISWQEVCSNNDNIYMFQYYDLELYYSNTHYHAKQRTKQYLCKPCEEELPPPPPAEEDSTLWTKIYEGNPSLAPAECYETDGINFKSYNFKTEACGDETMRCYSKVVPPLVCDVGYTNLHADTQTECTNEVDEVINTYENVDSYFRNENNQNICCAKWDIIDNNDTGTDPTPDACESPKYDRPEYNWVHHAGITDHNACASLAIGDDRWWTFPYSGTVEKCCIGKRKENYVAPSCSELKPSHAGWTYIDVSSSSITNSNSCQNSITGGGTSEYGFYFVANSQNNCCFKIDYRGVGSSDGGSNNDNNETNGNNSNNNGSNGSGSSGSGSSGGTTATNDILSGIKSDINESNNALDSISKELNASNKNLEKIKESVDNFSNRNHSDLSDINNSINGLRNLSDGDKKERDGIRDNIAGVKEDMKNASNTITSNIATIAGSWSNVGTPFIAGGGNDFCFEVWSRRVCLDLSFLANMKPYFDILFAMILAFLNFKVYTRIVGFLLLIGL